MLLPRKSPAWLPTSAARFPPPPTAPRCAWTAESSRRVSDGEASEGWIFRGGTHVANQPNETKRTSPSDQDRARLQRRGFRRQDDRQPIGSGIRRGKAAAIADPGDGEIRRRRRR